MKHLRSITPEDRKSIVFRIFKMLYKSKFKIKIKKALELKIEMEEMFLQFEIVLRITITIDNCDVKVTLETLDSCHY